MILITGYSAKDERIKAIEAEAVGFLSKLIDTVEESGEKKNASQSETHLPWARIYRSFD
jgi:hypothetical protein